jgi:hypothetical protein
MACGGWQDVDILYNRQNHIACNIIDLVAQPQVNLKLDQEQCMQWITP